MKRTTVLYAALAACAILAQGFQCASSDLASARKAMQQQDYVKAKGALNKALIADSSNCDALIMLGDAHEKLKETDSSIAAYQRARQCPGLKSEQQTVLSVNLFNLWVAEYNAGISDYNQFVDKDDRGSLSSARQHLKRALTVKPEFTDPYVLLGQVNEVLGDTTAGVRAYQDWWELERPGYELIRSKQLTIGATRGAVMKAFGTPVYTKMDTSASSILYKDRFDVGGRDMITFSMSESGADATLEGWTYNMPATVTDPERWRARYSSVSPLKSLAFISYQRGAYNDALTWVNLVTAFKPTEQDIVPLRTQLLQNLGKTEEAMAQLKAQIEREPGAVSARLQYAGMLSAEGRYEDAITQYAAVLQTDANNESALYNLAANYKNVASTKQRAELEKMDKNRKYVPDTTYMNDLKSSAQYFERLRKASVKYKDDLVVMEQLANVYEVRKETSRVQAIIRELEALEEKYRLNKDYYRVMEGLYARNKMMDKMKEVQAKGAKL